MINNKFNYFDKKNGVIDKGKESICAWKRQSLSIEKSSNKQFRIKLGPGHVKSNLSSGVVHSVLEIKYPKLIKTVTKEITF